MISSFQKSPKGKCVTARVCDMELGHLRLPGLACWTEMSLEGLSASVVQNSL
jgi:hypothetical protein